MAVRPTLGNIYGLVLAQPGALVTFGGVPLLVVAAIEVAGAVLRARPDPDGASALFTMVSLAAGLWFATVYGLRWHRYVLLGEGGPASLAFGQREWRYLGMSIVLGFVSGIASLPLMLLASALGSALLGVPGDPEAVTPGQVQMIMLFVFAGGLIGVSAVFARLGLVLPGIAVDRPIAMGESWRLTSGRGWRNVGVMLVATVPIPVAMTLLIALLAQLLGPTSLTASLMSALSALPALAVAAVALSALYRAAVDPAPT